MNDFMNLGFRPLPSGGNDRFQQMLLVFIAFLLLGGLYQLYQMRRTAKLQTAKFQKPIELQPNQYIVRGVPGLYTKQKLIDLELWRD